MKVLVVDDSVTVRMIVSRVIAKLGHEVGEAEDGMVAWEEIQRAHSIGLAYEFVVTDVNMPRMDGLELIKKLRSDERFQSVGVGLVTSDGRDSTESIGESLQVLFLLRKPVRPDDIKMAFSSINF